MKYYINGKEVSYNDIKLEYYKEKYRINLIMIFITKLIYKYRLQIILFLSFIFIIIVAFGIANADNGEIIKKPSGNLCQNLAFSNPTRFKKECDISNTFNKIKAVKTGNIKKSNIEKTTIKWNRRNYSVQVWNDRVETMRKLGYSKQRILELLTILNMECGRYDGKCFNGNDIGPFQINKIHKKQYNQSWKFYNNPGKLFLYQLDYANKLLDSYDKRFCGKHIFKLIGRNYTEQRHWNCIAYSYNGHPRYKYAYAKLGWERMKIINKLIRD